jgi:hypothetical protein
MNTKIDASSVIGAKIDGIITKPTGLDLNTDLETFRFEIELSNGVVLELFPGDVCYQDDAIQIHNLGAEVSGPSGVVGGQIIAVATCLVGFVIQPSTDDDSQIGSANLLHDIPRHVAFILSNGNALLNFYMCGGGSELQVLSVDGLKKHFGKPWRDFWTDEIVEIDRLPVAV